jgi:hypothetical protein
VALAGDLREDARRPDDRIRLVGPVFRPEVDRRIESVRDAALEPDGVRVARVGVARKALLDDAREGLAVAGDGQLVHVGVGVVDALDGDLDDFDGLGPLADRPVEFLPARRGDPFRVADTRRQRGRVGPDRRDEHRTQHRPLAGLVDAELHTRSGAGTVNSLVVDPLRGVCDRSVCIRVDSARLEAEHAGRVHSSLVVSIPSALLSPQKQVTALTPNPTAPTAARTPAERRPFRSAESATTVRTAASTARAIRSYPPTFVSVSIPDVGARWSLTFSSSHS